MQISKELAERIGYSDQTKREFPRLHLYTAKGDLESIIKLLSNEDDSQITRFEKKCIDSTYVGNTALHIAVMGGFLEIVRTLLVLGADPNVENYDDETPRHIASAVKNKSILHALIVCGANVCSSACDNCNPGCTGESPFTSNLMSTSAFDPELKNVEDKSFESTLATDSDECSEQDAIYEDLLKDLQKAKEDASDRSNFINVLALDGGGIRGLVILQVLIVIEKQLGEPVYHYFDWVAGTSTGAIIAAALAKGKSLQDCQKIYLRLKNKVFNGMWPYSTKTLEKLIKQEIGKNTRLSDLPWPRLTIPTVKIDERPARTVLMCNYSTTSSSEDDDLLLWKVLRRTSAAPIYFSPAEGKYIDGGLSSNNPTQDLLTEVNTWNKQQRNKKVRIGCVLSVGTGVASNVQLAETYRITKNPFYIKRTAKSAYMISKQAIDIVTASEGRPVENAHAQCYASGVPYFRLNPTLSKDVALNATNVTDIARMMWESVYYAHKNRSYIEKMALLLKEIGPSIHRKKLFENLPQQINRILPVNEYIIPAKSNDPSIKHIALSKLRQSLSETNNLIARCKEILKGGMFPIIVESIKDKNNNIHVEALIIFNIVVSMTRSKVDAEVIPSIFGHLGSDDPDIRTHAIQAIGNCIRDSPNQDVCANLGLISVMTQMILAETSLSFLRHAATVLKIYCERVETSTQLAEKMALPLSKLVEQNDKRILLQTLDAISNFASDHYIKPFNDLNIFDKMKCNLAIICKTLYRLFTEYDLYEYSLLYILSKIAVDDASQIQALIDAQLLRVVVDCLEKDTYIKYKAHEMLSALIFNGNSIQVLAVINTPKFFPLYCKSLCFDERNCKTLRHLNVIMEKVDINEIREKLSGNDVIEMTKQLQNYKTDEIVNLSNQFVTNFEFYGTFVNFEFE